MRLTFLLISAIAIMSLAGCSYQPARISTVPAIVIDDGGYGKDRVRRHREYGEGRYHNHETPIPPGHLPPPGECRDWDPNLPPGQQPPPYKC